MFAHVYILINLIFFLN